jgi:hypothetical protein
MGTPIYNLPYPTDYTGIADVPEWLKDLADATEGALGNIDLSNYYTKAEIDNMIGDIDTALDLLNGEVIS